MNPTDSPRLQEVVQRLAQAMSRQRIALEAENYDDLETVLPECEAALYVVTQYPGGVEALRGQMDLLPVTERTALLEALERAAVDHRVGRELIAIAMQRNAALQGFVVNQSEGATYSSEGAVSHATGSLLSRKV